MTAMEFAICSGMEDRVPTPPDIRHEIPGLCRQVMNRAPPQRRLTHVVPQTIQENVELDRGGVLANAVANNPSKPVAPPKRRRHTVGVPPQGTIRVPSDHPLLAGGLANTNNTMYEIVQDPNPAIVVSQYDNVEFPSSDSGFHSLHLSEPMAQTAVARRFSEGNGPHMEFHQQRSYCSSSPLNQLRLIQEEHQKLQEQYQPWLSPAQLVEQQRLHAVYKEKYIEMQEELEKQYSQNVQKVETETNPLSTEFQKLQIQRPPPPYQQSAHQAVVKSCMFKRSPKKISPYSTHRAIERIDSDDIEYPPSETNDSYTLLSL